MNTYDSKYMYTMTKTSFEGLASEDFSLNKKLDVEVLENAIILPPKQKNGLLVGAGGVQRDDGSYVELSAQRAYRMTERVYGNYSVELDDLDYEDCTVVYINYFIKHWGHFLLDVVGRLWWILNRDCENLQFVYTTSDGVTMNGNYLEFMTLLGIKESQLMPLTSPKKYKKVIVPEMAIYPGKHYTQSYKDIFNYLINICTDMEQICNKATSIYCSRSVFSNENEFNEDRIEKIFKENGYKVVFMEKMSVREQILTMQNASSIAMLSGTLMHNLLFARDGVEAIVCYKAYFKYINQHIINQCRQVKFLPIDVWYLPLPITTFGPFYFVISREFVRFIQDKGWKVAESDLDIGINDLFKRLRFWCRWLRVNYRRILKGTLYEECTYSKKELAELVKVTREFQKELLKEIR